MDSALFDQLVTKLRTKTDVLAVLSCLEEFVASFFSAKSLEDQQEIFKRLPKDTAEILVQSLVREAITPENQITIKRHIDELRTELSACKTVQITLAFEPNDETLTLFSDWIKKNVNPELLIDLQFDKTIVGGILLIADGVYKDYSIRKRLANRFQIQREEIMAFVK